LRKKQTIFLTPTIYKKIEFVTFGIKKANLASLGAEAAYTLFHLLTCEWR